MNIANRQSYFKELSPLREEISYIRKITDEEYEKIHQGFSPKENSDKWYIFLEEDKIFFYRSWSGECIFIAEYSNKEKEIQNIIVCRDPDIYEFYSFKDDILLFEDLLYNLLLE